jgi:hypothetical protein
VLSAWCLVLSGDIFYRRLEAYGWRLRKDAEAPW